MDRLDKSDWEVPKINRRQGADYVKLSSFWIGVLCWVLFATTLVIFFKAMPEDHTVLSRVRGKLVRDYWDFNLLGYNFFISFSLLISSFIGILINRSRMKRKEDKYNKFLLIMFFYSIITMMATSMMV